MLTTYYGSSFSHLILESDLSQERLGWLSIGGRKHAFVGHHHR